MSESFSLGKNGQFGQIDFSKLKSGLKKEDITGGDKELESIWAMIDDGNGVLDKKEIEALKNKIKELAGDDNKLSKKEAKRFVDENGEKIGKQGREALYNFLNKLAEKTKDVDNISNNIINGKECEVVKYNGGKKIEYQFDDGSKIIEEDNTKTHYDKDGNITKTEVKGNEKTTVTEYEKGEVKRKEVTNYDGCQEITEYKNGEISKVIKRTPTGDVYTEIDYENSKPVEETTVETNENTGKKKKIVKDANGNVKETVENYGEKGFQISNKKEKTENGYRETKVEEALGRESKTNFNDNNKRTEQVVKKDGKTYSVKYDGKGNTFIVVQFGETIDSIAAKFGCDKQAIIDLNDGKTKFTPGDEILIPGQLEADADILKNRKSATESRAEYNKALDKALEAARKKREAEESTAPATIEAPKAKEPVYTAEEIKMQKESAKQIVDDLKKAIRGYNDHGAIQKALARIDHPVELEEVNNLLAAEGYKASDMYSAVEKFINQELQRVETDYSCEELETLVQNWIDKGLLKGQAAIDAQARLAARVICDGGDGVGTDPDKIKKGIYMIKAPAGQGSEAAKKVYEQVNKIIANHNTFYGIGTKCKDLMDYLDGELWDSEIKYLKGILAENDAVQGVEKAEAISDLVDEAVDGAGTDIDALKQAIKAIKTPEDRKAVEEKLAEYCEKNGIKPPVEGMSPLQMIMYTECDTFMGFSTDHAEIRKFNEMLISQGAYTKQEAIKIRAEQAALQILEGDFDNIQDAVKNIKDKEVLAKLDELLKSKGFGGLDDFLDKKLVQTDIDLVNAELASNNLLSNEKAANVAFRLVQNSDFDTRAMGLKAIINEQVAKLVDAKLKEVGSSLNKIYDQFNKEKAEYKSRAAIWDGLAIVLGSTAEYISDKYRENTDVSDNIYVESDNAVELTPAQKQAYEMTIQVFEEKLEEMIKAYEEALESQGIVSDAVNAFCERWNIGTTRDEIEARIEHDKETLRLLKLAAEGKLSKIVDGKTISVTFEDVFKERQAEKVTANGISATGEVNNDFKFDAQKVEAVSLQAQRMGAMNHMKATIASCWADLETGTKGDDLKRLAVGIYSALQKISELNGQQLSLEGLGYKLNDEGFIVNKNGMIVPPQDLMNVVNGLKSVLAEMANNIFSKGITVDMNADSVKNLLDEGYEEEIEKFKQEYREAFNQEPTDEIIDKYIETINTGKTVVNFAAVIGAAVLAPITAGGSLAAVLGVSLPAGSAIAAGLASAATSMAVNAAEKSTDSDGYTNLEWTSDAEQALWDGAMTAAGLKVGAIAEKFARGAMNVKFAQSLLAKNKSVLSTMIKNPTTLEKATVWVARVEAAGFEISSDALQSIVQMYCQEGHFDEAAFLQALVMSVAGNAVGHVVAGRADVQDVGSPKPVSDLSTTEMIREYENIPDSFDHLPEAERAAAQQRAAELLNRMTREGYVVQGQMIEPKAIFEKMISTSDDMSKVRAELANNPEFQKLSQKEQLEIIGKINRRDAELQAAAAKKQAEEANAKEDVKSSEDAKKSEEAKKAKEAEDAKRAEEAKKAKEAEDARRADDPEDLSEEGIKAKAAKIKEKYGQKVADMCTSVLNRIKNMLTKVDYDNISAYIKRQFADLKELKNMLMETLEVNFRKFASRFNPNSVGSKHFDRVTVDKFVNSMNGRPRDIVDYLTAKGFKPTKAHNVKYAGNEFISLYSPKEGVLYTFVFNNGQLKNKSMTYATQHMDGSFTRHSDLEVNYENNSRTVTIKDGEKVVYEKKWEAKSADGASNSRRAGQQEGASGSQRATHSEGAKRAYSKFNKSQRPVEFPKNGMLDQNAQYALNLNDMPTLRLTDGTILNLNSPEIRNKIMNLRDGEFLTIGRDGDIKISNTNDYVSRDHFVIARENGVVQLKDVSANSKTRAMSSEYAAARQSATRKYNEYIKPIDMPKSGVLSQKGQYILGKDMPKLTLRDGTVVDLNSPEILDEIIKLKEGGFLTIGRNGAADIGVSNSDTISRHHLIITRRNGQFILKDVSSYGGTKCNAPSGGHRANNDSNSGRANNDGSNRRANNDQKANNEGSRADSGQQANNNRYQDMTPEQKAARIETLEKEINTAPIAQKIKAEFGGPGNILDPNVEFKNGDNFLNFYEKYIRKVNHLTHSDRSSGVAISDELQQILNELQGFRTKYRKNPQAVTAAKVNGLLDKFRKKVDYFLDVDTKKAEIEKLGGSKKSQASDGAKAANGAEQAKYSSKIKQDKNVNAKDISLQEKELASRNGYHDYKVMDNGVTEISTPNGKLTPEEVGFANWTNGGYDQRTSVYTLDMRSAFLGPNSRKNVAYNAKTNASIIKINGEKEPGVSRPYDSCIRVQGKVSEQDAQALIAYLDKNVPNFRTDKVKPEDVQKYVAEFFNNL